MKHEDWKIFAMGGVLFVIMLLNPAYFALAYVAAGAIVGLVATVVTIFKQR